MDQDETWCAGRPWLRTHCVRWGPSSPPPNGKSTPIFGPYLLWPNGCMDQDATRYGGGPGHFVLDGDPAPPFPKGGGARQIVGPCLFRLNGSMDQGGTWHGGRPQPRGLCVRWRPTLSPKRGLSPPIFGPCLLWPNGWMHQDPRYRGRAQPWGLCVR